MWLSEGRLDDRFALDRATIYRPNVVVFVLDSMAMVGRYKNVCHRAVLVYQAAGLLRDRALSGIQFADIRLTSHIATSGLRQYVNLINLVINLDNQAIVTQFSIFNKKV